MVDGIMATSFKRRHAFVLLHLRGNPTPAEHEFCCRLESLGQDYRFQQTFYHPEYRIVDFYLPDHNLIIESDGAYHDPETDARRDEWFSRVRGIPILRLTNEQVLSGDFRGLENAFRPKTVPTNC